MKTRNANADRSVYSLLVIKVGGKYFNHLTFGVDIETCDVDYQITRKVQMMKWALNRGYSINDITFNVIKTAEYNYDMYKAVINDRI